MPYIKTKDPPFSRMARLLKGYDLTTTRLAEVLGCSKPTARARLLEPENLTLRELLTISQKGHVPMEEIRDAFIQ